MTGFQRFPISFARSVLVARIFLVVFFLLFSCPSHAQQDQFEKKEWAESHITLLAPRDWQVLLEKSDDAPICHISPEPIDATTASYQVGLAINILRSVPSTMGQKPSEYAQSLIEQIRERSDQEITVQSTQSTLFKIYRVEYSLVTDDESMNIINILEANDSTGTLYMMIWQAPESKAQSFSEMREKVLNSIHLDPAF